MTESSAARAHPVNGDFAYNDEPFMDDDLVVDLNSPSPTMTPSPTAHYTESGSHFARPQVAQSKMNKLLFGDKSKKKEKKNSSFSVPTTPATKVRVIAAVLWIAVIAGAVGGVYAFMGGGNSNKGPAAVTIPDSSGAQGFAQQYLRTYLGRASANNADQLKTYYPGLSTDLQGMQANQYFPLQVAVMYTDYLGDNYWSFLLSADVMRSSTQGLQLESAPLYFKVGIKQLTVADPTTKRPHLTYEATALPARVAAPVIPQGSDITTPTVDMSGIGDADLSNTVQGFFTAYFTGQPNPDPYISANADFNDITPPIAKSVEIAGQGSQVANDGTTLVHAAVRIIDNNGFADVYEYYLQVVKESQ